MSAKQDDVQVRVFIDGKQAINELGKLEMEAVDLKRSLKDLKKGTEEYIAANNRLNDVKNQIGDLRQEMGLAGMTMNQMKSYARDLQNQLDNTTKGTERWSQLNSKLKEVNATMRAQKAELKESESIWQKLRKEAGTFGMVALGYLGFEAITGKIGSIISGNAKLSDSLADIRKTTGMTTAEVKQLNKELSNINTRTANDELRKIAIVAGQLGIAKSQVLGFTDSIDKAVVALGDEFSGGAEEVAKVLGGLRGVFTDIKTDNVGDNLLKIGNAINELGAAGSATGPVVADFANRIGGVGITLGLTSGEVLGMSATLQELNVSAERGGTAVVKIMQKMTTETATFAKIAGMEVSAFEKMLNEDLYGAFKAVLEGSQKSASSATAFAAVLKDAELQGAGASEIFAKLGANTKLLDEKVSLANNSLGNTNSILGEFGIKNDNLAAKLEKLQKWIAGAFTNPEINAFLENMVNQFIKLIPPVDTAQQKLEKVNDAFNMEINILKTGNFTQEERKRLISEINEKYGEYMPNLLSENATLKEIEDIQRKVNTQIQAKILLMDYEQEITDIYKTQKEALEGLYKTEKNRSSLKFDVNMDNANMEKSFKQVYDAADKLNQGLVDNTDKRLEETKEKYSQLASFIGVNFNELLSKQSSSPEAVIENKKTTSVGSSSDVSKSLSGMDDRELFSSKQKEYEQILKGIEEFQGKLDEFDQKQAIKKQTKLESELAAVDIKYQQLAQKAYDGQKSIEESEFLAEEEKQKRIEEYSLMLQELEDQKKIEKEAIIKADNDRVFAERASFQESLLSQEMSYLDKELAAVNKHFENLINQAKKYGIDTKKLEDERIKAIQKVQNDFRREQIAQNAQYYQQSFSSAESFFTSLSSIVDTAASDSSRKSRAHVETMRALKLAEIGANSAAAISSVIAYAASSSPDPITLAARIAAGTSIVITNIASAKKFFKENPIPGQLGGSTARSDDSEQSANAKNFNIQQKAEGGFTNDKSSMGSLYFKPSPTAELAWVNEKGVEHITPNWMVENPKYRPYIDFLESERLKGFADGGFTNDTAVAIPSTGSSVDSMNNTGMIEFTKAINRLNYNLENPKPGVALLNYDYFVEKSTEIQEIEQKATIA